MLSHIITAAVDGYAALDRASDRRKMIDAAESRVAAYEAAGRDRSFVIVRSAGEMRDGLLSLPADSATIFVDCALECCVGEDDLLRCWAELQRVSGATDARADDLFVLCIQRWASARATFDPRVRWIVVGAPPRRDGSGALEYRPFGRRRTVLADVKRERAEARAKTATEAAVATAGKNKEPRP